MNRILLLAVAILGAGCIGPPRKPPAVDNLQKLHSPKPEESAEAFQYFIRMGAPLTGMLKAALPMGDRSGYPAAALLYAHGEGDAVPLDIRARHLALFRWPEEYDCRNAVMESYVRNEIERDLARAGRPALRLLSQALAREAPDEARAMRVARAMLRAGGRAAEEEFTRLLDCGRDLGGFPVRDVAAAALAYLERPAGEPVAPKTLLPLLSGGREEAFAANRRLEELTGACLYLPPLNRLEELRSAVRLWQPPPGLAVRWRRYLDSSLLRLSIAAVGGGRVLWAYDQYLHATEDETGGSRAADGEGESILHVQSRDLGTRLVYVEYRATADGAGGFSSEFPALRPVVVLSPVFRACVIVTIDTAGARRPSRPPELIGAEMHRRLRRLAESAEGPELRKALRGLGYFQDPEDAELLRSKGAGEALLLLGDPAALELQPRLEPYEVEMALRKAEDPRVKAYLEGLRKRE